jgi:hypothetical protein
MSLALVRTSGWSISHCHSTLAGGVHHADVDAPVVEVPAVGVVVAGVVVAGGVLAGVVLAGVVVAGTVTGGDVVVVVGAAGVAVEDGEEVLGDR